MESRILNREEGEDTVVLGIAFLESLIPRRFLCKLCMQNQNFEIKCRKAR